jgi:hypothetical protein
MFTKAPSYPNLVINPAKGGTPAKENRFNPKVIKIGYNLRGLLLITSKVTTSLNRRSIINIFIVVIP